MVVVMSWPNDSGGRSPMGGWSPNLVPERCAHCLLVTEAILSANTLRIGDQQSVKGISGSSVAVIVRGSPRTDMLIF